MTASQDRELQAWITDWSEPTADATPFDVVRLHVKRRSRLIRWWLITQTVIAAVALSFLIHRAATHPDPVERLAMAALALITALALGFEYWNWRGAWKPATETTSRFLQLSAERCRRLRRGVLAGWVMLVGEVAVFVPWVAHRLGPIEAPPRWPWAFLIGMVGLVALGLVALDQWARREAREIDALRRELDQS